VPPVFHSGAQEAAPAAPENAAPAPSTEPTSKNNARLKQALQAFPQADTNRDGVLTLEEARPIAAMLGISADDLKAQVEQGPLAPRESNVAYGPDPRQVLDFWKPESSGPAPVVVLIHGGGFKYGSKADLPKVLGPLIAGLLKNGIAVASINYRLVRTAPLQESLRDGARAVQFLRSKSNDWNLDKNHIGAIGGSGGAGMSLWLATRDDLADPSSSDPVLKESSRVGPIILMETQATYNFPRWESYMGKAEFPPTPGSAAAMFHLAGDADLETPAGQALLREVDMLEWIGPGEGPVLAVLTRYGAGRPDTNTSWDAYVHSSKHAKEIKRVCDEKGSVCEITADKSAMLPFLLKTLKPGAGPPQQATVPPGAPVPSG